MNLTKEQKKEVYDAKFQMRGRRGKRNRAQWSKVWSEARSTLAKYDIEYAPKWMQL
jgi:hypothetical protein